MPSLRLHNSLRRAVTLVGATLAVALALPGASAPLSAQAVKRPLEIADYALWRSLSGEVISPDGEWVAWSYGRERGDDTLHVKMVGRDGLHTVPFATRPEFSSDSRWVAYGIGVSFADAEKEEGDPTPQAGLLDLATGTTWSWDNVEDFGFSPSGSYFWLKKEKADDDLEHDGTDLLLRRLSDGAVEVLGSVDEAAFHESGRWLAWTVDAADATGNGLYLLELATGVRRTLDHAEARYARLTWAEDVAALAVLRGDTLAGKVERENTLVAVTRLDGSERRITRLQGHLTPEEEDEAPANGVAPGWVLSERSALSWSDDGAVIFVGTRPQADEPDPWPDDALPLADVNIWHWADDRIQSQQQRTATRDSARTWRAAAWLGSEGAHTAGQGEARVVPLEEAELQVLHLSDDGRTAIARDPAPYISDWEPDWADWYLVDTRTGARTLIAEQLQYGMDLSPDGGHWLYWSDEHLHAYDVAAGTHRVLTQGAPVSFTDTEWDYFGEPPPWGVAGFSTDGNHVILNGAYDLWRQPLSGGAAVNLTGEWGRENEARLRLLPLDPEADGVDLSSPLFATTFGMKTKQSGFVQVENAETEGGGAARVLTVDDARWGRPVKADDAERLLVSRQSWSEFPDLHVVSTDFQQRTRITDANPQQAEFLWGRRILFDYTLSDGTELQGTLAIPDTYREGERLPMIVRFYEQDSHQLHAYPTPIYRHQPNFAGYVSRGYLLMQPDVKFRLRTTHSDMLEAVEAATRKVIELGYADPARVGLSGHSFSGGGSAFIATRSNMFAAIAHGAAPINLVSEFNQLFVGSGANNHGYDISGQGRYATNPYDDFELYWDQSPISGVQQMNTPVLYLHGEEDSIVNWEQGLEWYNALRFLGKPIIWLSYPDEDHGLRKLENRIDFQLRLKQFFDHHLKGDPAPAWMTEGVPQVEKERHLRDFAPGGIPFGGGRTGRGG